MKKIWKTLIPLILILLIPTFVFAQSSKPWTPENVEVAYPEEGWFCLWTAGVFNGCYSCCNELQKECENCNLDCPECKKCEKCESCEDCKECEECEVCEECEECPECKECKEKKDKPMCNCGGGNGGEDCNPNPNCDEKKNNKQDE